MTATSFDLDRFVDAQRDVHATALAEVRVGNKRSHWMWFVFPQIAGLGSSPMAQRYAIASLDEARAYLAHPVLGDRLTAMVATLQDVPHANAEAVFGTTDAMKLRSSLTLFIAAGAPSVFAAALDRWFGGHADAATLELIAS